MRDLFVYSCLLIALSSPASIKRATYNQQINLNLTPLVQAPQIDPEFQLFVDDFVERSKGKIATQHIKKLSIRFAPLGYSKRGKGEIGVCYWWPFDDEPALIEIDPMYWASEDIYSQWSLIFHELGHCVCNRGHTRSKTDWFILWLGRLGIKHHRAGLLPDGCPVSIMNPTDFPSRCIHKHQEHYVRELFAGCEPSVL